MFSIYNKIKPRNQLQKEIRQKSPNNWELNNIHLNNPWVNVKVTRELRKYQHIKVCRDHVMYFQKEKKKVSNQQPFKLTPEKSKGI